MHVCATKKTPRTLCLIGHFSAEQFSFTIVSRWGAARVGYSTNRCKCKKQRFMGVIRTVANMVHFYYFSAKLKRKITIRLFHSGGLSTKAYNDTTFWAAAETVRKAIATLHHGLTLVYRPNFFFNYVQNLFLPDDAMLSFCLSTDEIR